MGPYGPEGSVIILVKKEKQEKSNHRILYISSERTVGVLVSSSQLRGKLLGKGNFLKKILQSVDPLLSAKSFYKCESDIHDTITELEKLEATHILKQKNFKIGVLNWQAKNKNEEDMFSNDTISANFKEFLEILGDKVKLLGWDKYSGGLDTTPTAETGKYSIFTKYEGCAIMYHVAPYLPLSSSNTQQVFSLFLFLFISLFLHDRKFQLARKRHIGNDVVVIVFNESKKPYLASLVASQFIHVIIVVSKQVDENQKSFYSVAVTAKSDVPAFGPILPAIGRFYSKDALRSFLLQKMINAEKASVYASAFVSRLKRSRQCLLNCLMQTTNPPMNSEFNVQ